MPFPHLLRHSILKNNLVLDWVLAPLASLILILATHCGLFLGHSFLVGEDTFLLFNYNVGNLQSSGWRPDLGLGVSWMMGDPGTSHPWSLFRWWHELFSNPLTGYQTSIIVFIWAACVAQYFLLRKALPNLNRSIVYALSCMIAFGSLRYNYFFFPSYFGLFPAIIPIISLLLFDFQEKPSPKHYFLYALTLTLSLLLGSSITLLLTILFSLAFFSVQLLYDRHNLKLENFWVRVRGFFFLNTIACISIFVLGAWTFYSILIESLLQDYIRDPVYVSFSTITPDLKFLFKRLLEYLHAGLFSEAASVLGIKQALGASGRNNISPLFPVFLLAILFFKSRNFWEFTTKFLILGTIVFQELTTWIPALITILQELFKLRPPTNFHPVLHVYGTLWLGIILTRVLNEEKIFLDGRLVTSRVLSALLSIIYAGLFLISIFSWVAPEFLNLILLKSWNAVSTTMFSQSLKTLIPPLISESVNLFHETLSWSSILFYGFTFVLLGLFATKDWGKIFRWKNGKGIAYALLANSILFSWAVYPLNKEPLIWDRQNISQGKLFDSFAPTDRFMRVSLPSCHIDPDPYPCIQEKFLNRAFGPRRFSVGHMKTPGLELSGAKSFTQREVFEFVSTLIKPENPELSLSYTKKMEKKGGLMRRLQLDPPIYSSKAYNISAVNYLLSPDPLPKSSNRQLIYSSHLFYLYKNLDSWPYFYLADRIEAMSEYKDLQDAKKGTAYLWETGPKISILPRTLDSSETVQLALFEFNRMEFDYSSGKSEFLVISDAWHPRWRAKVNGIDTDIVKTNGVFKGILLPPGKGKVQLHFDNSSYRGGIWISLAGWILFIGSWIGFARRSRNQSPQGRLGLAN